MLCSIQPPAEPHLSPATRVTRAIIDALKRGVRPWACPWSADGSIALPRRANGLAYKGVNTVALWATALERGFTSPYWLTFKQAQSFSATVRKGERGAYVIYYGDRPNCGDDPDQAEPARRQRVLRGYTVFCADQIDGLPAQFPTTATALAPLSEREASLLANVELVPASVQHGGDRAYYAPASDQIHLPPCAAFSNFGAYLITRLHESAHWTRAPSRLHRDFGQKRFGDAGYALEELVAELGAAMLGATLEVPGEHIEDHAGYVASWLEVIEHQPSAFLTAAGKAQQACDYLLGLMSAESAPPE